MNAETLATALAAKWQWTVAQSLDREIWMVMEPAGHGCGAALRDETGTLKIRMIIGRELREFLPIVGGSLSIGVSRQRHLDAVVRDVTRRFYARYSERIAQLVARYHEACTVKEQRSAILALLLNASGGDMMQRPYSNAQPAVIFGSATRAGPHGSASVTQAGTTAAMCELQLSNVPLDLAVHIVALLGEYRES